MSTQHVPNHVMVSLHYHMQSTRCGLQLAACSGGWEAKQALTGCWVQMRACPAITLLAPPPPPPRPQHMKTPLVTPATIVPCCTTQLTSSSTFNSCWLQHPPTWVDLYTDLLDRPALQTSSNASTTTLHTGTSNSTADCRPHDGRSPLLHGQQGQVANYQRCAWVGEEHCQLHQGATPPLLRTVYTMQTQVVSTQHLTQHS